MGISPGWPREDQGGGRGGGEGGLGDTQGSRANSAAEVNYGAAPEKGILRGQQSELEKGSI